MREKLKNGRSINFPRYQWHKTRTINNLVVIHLPTDISEIKDKETEDLKIHILNHGFRIMLKFIYSNMSLSTTYSLRFYLANPMYLSTLYLILNITWENFKNYVCEKLIFFNMQDQNVIIFMVIYFEANLNDLQVSVKIPSFPRTDLGSILT